MKIWKMREAEPGEMLVVFDALPHGLSGTRSASVVVVIASVVLPLLSCVADHCTPLLMKRPTRAPGINSQLAARTATNGDITDSGLNRHFFITTFLISLFSLLDSDLLYVLVLYLTCGYLCDCFPTLCFKISFINFYTHTNNLWFSPCSTNNKWRNFS